MTPISRFVVPAPISPFLERLQEGEKILWQGRPDVALFVWPKVIGGSLLLIPVVPPMMWLVSWLHGAPLAWLSAPMLLMSALVYVGMAAYTQQHVRAQAEAALYALTDRRVLIRRLERLTSQDWRPRVDEYPLAAVRPSLRLLGRGRGTITLGAPILAYEKALRAVPEAAAVFALLTQTRAALAAPETGRAYYQAATEPAAVAAFSLADGLRQGETILWEGGMDGDRYWRSEARGMAFLVVILSAVGGDALYLNGWWTFLSQGLLVAALAGVGFPLTRLVCTRTAKNRRYALTSQRILVVKGAGGLRPQTDERDLAETAAMRLTRGPGGFGTVVFDKRTRVEGHAVETYEFSFKHVADADAVFAQVRAARESRHAASNLPPGVVA